MFVPLLLRVKLKPCVIFGCKFLARKKKKTLMAIVTYFNFKTMSELLLFSVVFFFLSLFHPLLYFSLRENKGRLWKISTHPVFITHEGVLEQQLCLGLAAPGCPVFLFFPSSNVTFSSGFELHFSSNPKFPKVKFGNARKIKRLESKLCFSYSRAERIPF